MKKSLLFVIDSLHSAGAEKSLVTLLSLLDYSSYEVDLMLFGHGGALEELVPKEVNILKPLAYTEFSKKGLRQALGVSIKRMNFSMFVSRIRYSFRIRQKPYRNAQKARIFWESVSNVIPQNPKVYDAAISYAQGVPTFYVAEKVKAIRKFAWVNTSYRLDEEDREFQKKLYDEYERIVAVSHSAKDVFLETFPYYETKVSIIYDINDPKKILSLANMGEGYRDQFNGIKILTIGRLDPHKGYDIALNACQRLKKKGINFKWYALGKGPLKEEIEKSIKEYNLTEHFILLGVTSNPYPLIKDADIYVQTSRFEGFGLAIAEARMLNVPVVTTQFDAVYNQMVEGKNGLVVDMNGEAVAEGIIRLIEDEGLRASIKEYLSKEKKGNVEEVEKFYQLISQC